MNYEEAVAEAQAHFEITYRFTVVYALPDGWAWCDITAYTLDESIHPFQLAWSSDAQPSVNAACLACAISWQQANE